MEKERYVGRALHMGNNLLCNLRQSCVSNTNDIYICIIGHSREVIGIGYSQWFG
jgi:hypothetical protein